MSEQWKSGGNCDECRRKPYCKTQCGKNKEAVRKFVQEKMAEYLKSMTNKKEESETR